MALGYWCIPIMNCNSENAQQKYISNKIKKTKTLNEKIEI